jgi:hypothetical protein
MKRILFTSIAMTFGCVPPIVLAPLKADVGLQRKEVADKKSQSCVACHGSTDSPSMHASTGLRLGCTDCHGGSPEVAAPQGMKRGAPEYERAMEEAHVHPRFPDRWKRADGSYSSANPQRSYALLNQEDPRFVRFVNPGDLRAAPFVCAPCHPREVEQVESSLMTTSAAFFGAASYNNGIVAPAIGAQKTPFLGESYAPDGTAREIQSDHPLRSEEVKKGVLPYVLPLPRWQVLPPGDIFRVFERGGRSISSSFPDIGTAPSRAVQEPSEEDPGRPDIRQSMRGPGTGLRIAVPVLNIHKTRLNDPHLSFLGTNDNPGDYRSSGCTACHVVYANDRDPLDSGPYASFGNRGHSASKDPTIPKDEPGHPLSHQFTIAIPTSQCMVCHMHQPNVFVNSFLGYTMWDYETDGDFMWPKEQRRPSVDEIYDSLIRNPEEAATRGSWSDPEFLARVSEMNPKLRHTQFADYHGHGWNFRAVFKRDRHGNLLDDKGGIVSEVTPEKLQSAMKPRTEEEWAHGRPGIPVHLKDIHLEKGMHCVDCHFAQDVHGSGKLYGQFADAIEISCIDCHGTIDARASLRTSGPAAVPGGRYLQGERTPFKELRFEWRGTKLFQRSMMEKGKEWEVVQVIDTIDPDSEWSRAHPEQAEQSRLAKTIERDGRTWGVRPQDAGALAHSNDRVACFTCHLSWTTSCGGCHLPIKANWKKAQNHFEGDVTRNWASYNPQVLRDDQFILGIHGTTRRGGIDKILVAPVRSSSALVLSSENTNREHIYVQQPPISAAGFSSQAFAPHFPHTVRATETKRCADCHVSADNDNNAWMAQLLGHGTNFTNFLGRYVWVGEGEGIEAVPVTEWDEPQAVIGSYLHKLAYPEDWAAHKGRQEMLPAGSAKHHGGGEIRSLQMRGEYLYVAAGEGGFRVLDISSVDNKGFSQNIVTAPVSPLGQDTHVATSFATAVALPTTMPVSPARQDRPAFVQHKDENQEQPMHPIYRYAFVTDRDEGLIAVDVETLADGDPDNNFLERAVTFNPGGALSGARNITIAGVHAYISCAKGLVIVSLNDPMHPEIVATIGEPALLAPTAVAIQFRYAFVLDRQGLEVIDVTNPRDPHPVPGARTAMADARDIYVARAYAYVAAGRSGLIIVDVEKPEHPRIDQSFDAGGRITDATAVRVGSTNASAFAYVADGAHGLRVIQLTSPESQPNYYGFDPKPVPQLIATYETREPALALSKGLDRDRAVDESGNQVSVFGRLGARPFTLPEQQRMYLRNGSLYTVTNAPPGPPTRAASAR